jgi:molecular chaperone DnaK
MIYSVEKTLTENREKFDSATVSELEAAIAEAKGKLDAEKAEDLNSAYDHLVKASHKLAEVMYKQQSGSQGGPSSGSGGNASGAAAGGGDDVIDAEYVDVDDKK